MASGVPPKVGLTIKAFRGMPSNVQGVLKTTAEGRNPHVNFPFLEMRLPRYEFLRDCCKEIANRRPDRGHVEHPPNTDRQEVRSSITVEFRGTPRGTFLAHLFLDGTIKTREEMHRENNQRTEEQNRLMAEESQFPHLKQTAIRQQAHTRMLTRIDALRRDQRMSVIAKQTEKANAEAEYRNLLHLQQQERIKDAAGSSSRSSRSSR